MSVDMAENNPKAKIREQIDENLKRIYDQALQEPLPDRMLELLEKLRGKAKAADAATDGSEPGRPSDDGQASS